MVKSLTELTDKLHKYFYLDYISYDTEMMKTFVITFKPDETRQMNATANYYTSLLNKNRQNYS